MINKSEAIRVSVEQRTNGGPRHTYILMCSYPKCAKEIRVRTDAFKKHSGMCKTHSHVKRPFESIYNTMRKDHRGTKVELTYEQFLDFMKVDKCHYCKAKIIRSPFPTVDGKFISMAHCLDKKNPNGPYSDSNCVVCCWNCNRVKCNILTYEEMKVAMEAVLKLRGGVCG
jgi:hypothetical protein